MCRNNIQFHMRFNLTDFSPYCSPCKSISSSSSSLHESNTEAAHQKCVFCFKNRTVDSCCATKKRKKRSHYDSVTKIVSRLLIVYASVALISLLPTANCLRQREDSLANIDTGDGGPMASHDSANGNSGHQNQFSPSESFHNEEIDEPDEPIADDYDVTKTPDLLRRYLQQNGQIVDDDYDDMVETADVGRKYSEQKLERSQNNHKVPSELNQFHRRLTEKTPKSANTKNKNDEIEADNKSSHAKSTEKTNVEESSGGTCAKSVAGGCKSREDMEVESIKKHLLFKLGMQKEPNVTKYPKISDAVMKIFCERYDMSEDACFGRKPDYQSDEYDSSTDEINDFDTDDVSDDEKYQYSAIQQRISTFPSTIRKGRHKQMNFEFSFPKSQKENNLVERATLNLYIFNEKKLKSLKPANLRNVQFIDIEISIPSPNSSRRREVYDLHRNISIPTDTGDADGKYIGFNITKLVRSWFKSQEGKHEIFLRIINSEKNELLSHKIVSLDDTNLGTMPTIDITPLDQRKTRMKRTPMECTKNETKCCRHELIVDFEEFGWDWIIAPKKYDANYCKGVCNIAYRQQYPHTHMMQMSTSASPCCSPGKMGKIQLLYFDAESQIVLSSIPNMRVEECFCS